MTRQFKRNPNGKTLLFLGGPADAVPTLGRAWALGYEVLVVDRDGLAPGLRWVTRMIRNGRCGIDGVIASAYDTEQVLDAVYTFQSQKGFNISGILAVGVDVAPIVSQVAEELNLPHIPENVTSLSWDKPALKKKLREANIPVPGSADFVVKPAFRGRGARGVGIVSASSDHYISGLEKVWEAKQKSNSGEVLFERFISGPQISAEVLFWDGSGELELVFAGYTDRDYEGGSWPVEKGGWGPSKYELQYGLKLDALVYKVARVVGLSSGVLKLDLVLDQEQDYQPTVIEAAIGRLGGGYNPSHYLPLSYGVDYLAAVFKIACGEDPTQALGTFVPGKPYRHVRGIYRNSKTATIHKDRGQFFMAIARSRKEAEQKVSRKVIQWKM